MMRAPLLACFLLGAVQDKEHQAGGKGVRMDYGPFLSSSVAVGKYRSEDELISAKGISIRVGKDATVCFDTDLLRMAAGWTGGFLDLSQTHLTSYKGSLPTRVAGRVRFGSAKRPGAWTGEDGADPRAVPYGPIPAEKGRYEGLVRNGDRVVLRYTVAGRGVLELPGYEEGVFTRTFKVAPSKTAIRIHLADEAPGVSARVGPGAALEKVRGGWVARIDALDRELLVRASIVFESGREAGADLVDPSSLVAGGPARWPDPLETKAMPGLGEGAYVVDTIAVPETNPWEAWLRFTGLDFFRDGRCALSTWNGDVWIVSGIGGDPEKPVWRRFAAGLYEPLGLKVVEDVVHVLGRDQITRLRDLNGDGEADAYENFYNLGTTMANYHAFALELQTDPEGNFYWIADGQRVESQVPFHGCLLKVAKDGRSHEVVATGLRAANGMGVGPNGEITCADNQGNWIPSSRLNWVRKGGFYGFVPHSHTKEPPREQDPPLCWLPMAIDNSSGGQVWATSDRWGPLGGHLLHTSYGTSWVFNVVHEKAGDLVQGGVMKLPLTFSSGIMRGRFNPKDGQLYVCGLRGWQTTGVRDGCLQRVRYTGKAANALASLSVMKGGLELVFTDPLDREVAGDVDTWGVLRWNYVWSEKYGSPDWSVEDPKKQKRDPVEVASVKVSEDGKTVFLAIPTLKPVMQQFVKARLRGADGSAIPFELYHTIHRIPD
jgi:hypothetical protein